MEYATIYEQQHTENPKVIRYEVIRIRVKRATQTPSGTLVPEREAYPSSGEWGQWAWTCWSLAQAQTLLAQLQTKVT